MKSELFNAAAGLELEAQSPSLRCNSERQVRSQNGITSTPGTASAIRDGSPNIHAKSKVQFSVATRDDDPEIRRMLRDNPMAGAISLSLEREPDFFADANLPGEEKQTILAREDGRVVCVGSCTTRARFVNGVPRRVGYLGSLRLDQHTAGRFDILRRGYEFFCELQMAKPADFYFTSIATDNRRARQFLERGIRGMPRYEFIGEFTTLLLAVNCRSALRHDAKSVLYREGGEGGDTRSWVEFVTHQTRQFQLAPCWTEKELRALERLGLGHEHFQSVYSDNQLVASAALWDQRSFKQTVIRGYSLGLACVRPLLNFAAWLWLGPGLPAPGTTLAHATALHLASAATEPETVLTLIQSLSALAKQRQIEFLTMGLAVNDPRLPIVRKHFQCREFSSRLYLVRWPGLGGGVSELDERVLQPELALL